MGEGFQRWNTGERKTPNNDRSSWTEDKMDERPVKPAENGGREWSNRSKVKRRCFNFSDLPIGAIVTVVLIVAAGVLIWTYRDLISSFLVTVLSWVLSVVITIAIVALILRLIFGPRRRGW